MSIGHVLQKTGDLFRAIVFENIKRTSTSPISQRVLTPINISKTKAKQKPMIYDVIKYLLLAYLKMSYVLAMCLKGEERRSSFIHAVATSAMTLSQSSPAMAN